MEMPTIGVMVFTVLLICLMWATIPSEIKFLGNILATIITTLAIILLVTVARYPVIGQLRTVDLEKNEIYEALGNVPLVNTYAVIVRNRDGKVLAYELETVPPPVFKVGDNNIYESYPDIKPTS